MADPVEVLGRLRGVVQAHVEWGPDGPALVEVVADDARPASRLIRDVRSALLASCGTDVPEDRVRVVRLHAADGAAARPRLELASVTVARTEGTVAVRVEVRADGAAAEACASGPPGDRSEPRLAAEAAAAAAGRLSHVGPVAVGDVRELTLAGERLVIVAAYVCGRGARRASFGVAPVVESAAEAAARAVVRAINVARDYR